eukprot:CAMPEP_0115522658 /NCGR_PEP_ID=MMETSP0271-20121206/80207_1 /TAXON_ID=71861 /ORGANISM="Scrippsiella trochoidea, Strain CCMP3099" /LENGTH=107 /DNA_ID=CAMNT_0002953991 /DNA_START=265 /DNA_END=588 /DNA_ORIENTATION=+
MALQWMQTPMQTGFGPSEFTSETAGGPGAGSCETSGLIPLLAAAPLPTPLPPSFDSSEALISAAACLAFNIAISEADVVAPPVNGCCAAAAAAPLLSPTEALVLPSC